MLLRQTEPADADHYISAATMGSPEQAQDTTAPRADPLDDVFGSDGEDYDSPAFVDEDEHGSDDSRVHITRGGARGEGGHPSDARRLRQEHTTAGYRDGITVAKASSVQAGFDEGFGLGATIGLRVGHLLGVLEGIAAGLGKRPAPGGVGGSAGGDGPDHEQARAAGKLLADARMELGVRSIFSGDYWHPDGTWKYEVGGGSGDVEEEGEVLFSHVTEAHPVVKKWTAVVEGEMRRWGLKERLPLLERREQEQDEKTAEAVARMNVRPVAQNHQPDAKAASDALSW
ncbi:hypothetical protein VSDG_06906 [Cytospora chrysosperma]|uniref:Protein YAE1 n=1 Tax=Cytospora chrysosperma TaxID=252740 RepID=A0A423VQK3_CYTCH|nr:hypothetical protein VSDG_06906 [Valsa sordida]